LLFVGTDPLGGQRELEGLQDVLFATAEGAEVAGQASEDVVDVAGVVEGAPFLYSRNMAPALKGQAVGS